LKLHYTDTGNGDTMIFIHGGFVNSAIWQPQVEFFSQRFRTIILDLRGHGNSGHGNEQEYTVSMLGQDVFELMDELNIDSAIICGMSLGGMIAQWMAATQPKRITGLCLIGTAASLKLTLIEKTVTTILFPKWMAMFLFSKLSTKQFLKLSFMLTWFMRGNKWLGNKDTRAQIRTCIGSMKREEIKKVYAAFHMFRKQNIVQGTYPVLLINGSFDSPVIHHHARYLKKKWGVRAQFIKLNNCGHACNFDDAPKFNGLLYRWAQKAANTANIQNQGLNFEPKKIAANI
jgi:pimeloyl-ACP methyl ester carboxylesterase